MFCTNCGNQMNAGEAFCTNCGAKQENVVAQPQPAPQVPVAPQVAYQPQQEPVYQQAPAEETVESQPIPQNAVMVTNWKDSKFDGGVLGLIGVNLAVAFLSVLSLGLAAPALFCYKLRWQYKHTIIGGYRMKFTGTGWQLFWRCLVWTLLTVITVGIFGLWVPIKYKKWEISHVEIDSVVAPIAAQ